MMMSSTTRKLEILDVEISELSEKFKIDLAVYKWRKTLYYHYQAQNIRRS